MASIASRKRVNEVTMSSGAEAPFIFNRLRGS